MATSSHVKRTWTIPLLCALLAGCGASTDEPESTSTAEGTGGSGAMAGQSGSAGQSGEGGNPAGSGGVDTGGSAGTGAAAGSGGAPDTGGSGGSSGATGGASGSGGSGGAATPSGRVIGYFAAWGVYGRDYHVADVPAHLLTHINYAFANISDDGRCVLGDPYADTDKAYPGDSWDEGAKRGSFHQLAILKQAHPHLRTLISVGGWTWSSKFSDVALTPTSRATFASSCVDFMIEHGFDGIDLDWEYPVGGGLPSNVTRPEDKQNYTLLLQELRSRLDARGATDGRSYLLTIAAPAGPSTIANMPASDMHAHLDWINLMNFHGSWSAMTNFHAPLAASSSDPSPDPATRDHLNVQSAVQAYRNAGVPADKLVVGVPFYGRGWASVAPQGNGLYQSFSGAPQGTWEAGVFDYHDLAANYVPTYARYWHDEARVPWLHNPTTGVMISYEDPESIAHKTAYILNEGLGGVMFWELSGDTSGNDLLHAIVDGLSP
nr:chitinase [uncultured bacterium]